MSKLPRDARAFAARVKMGSRRLWLIVEGKAHDRAFYDRVLSTVPGLSTSEYGIRLAQQLELDGISAGGKAFLLSLHDFYEAESLLDQSSRTGRRVIALAADRDFDEHADGLVVSDYLIYTEGPDVEAEILRHGDIHRAASSAYSLTQEVVSNVVPTSDDLFLRLAVLWRDWITCGLSAHCCGVANEVPHAHRSRINEHGFGNVIPAQRDDLKLRLETSMTTDTQRQRYEQLVQMIEDLFDANRHWTLMKGKWIASFVHHLIVTGLPDEPREANVTADTVVKTCIDTIDFSRPWADTYRARISTLVASA